MCCRRARPPAARCVLITGAGGAFGRALSLRFAAEGASLVLVDVDAAALARTHAALASAQASSARLLCDAGDAAAVAALPAAVRAAGLPPVDVVISNAAVARSADPGRLMAVNVCAALHLRAAFPDARALVLVASTMATVGAAGLAPYVASKWALLGLAESWRLEAQRDGAGADVVCVLPHAAADSALFAGAFGGARNSGLAAVVRGLTFPPVSAQRVADAVASAVAAGGSATFSVPWLFLPAAQCLRFCLPQAAHDVLVGFLGGWYGADELPQATATATAAAAAAAAAATARPSAPRRRRSPRAR